jgi:DNA integrity scanning protein DisA with diadenylate cyclase activity
LDTAFWASLLKEEGHSPKISLVFLAPDQLESPLLFEKPLPFTSHTLTKLSPGFERPGIHLGIWHNNGELYVWGATNKIPCYCFVLNVPEPGLLVIKHRKADEFGKFTNVAVLNGDEIRIVDEKSALLPDCPSLLTSLLGLKPTSDNSVNILVQLAVSMRAHGRGGSLIIVPSSSERWQNSIRQPINYSIQPAFSGLSKLIKEKKNHTDQGIWEATLRRGIDEMAGLTAIDGAIVMNDKYELLAFGAKITRAEGNNLVEKMLVTEPVIGYEGEIVPAGQNGGTRHLSATQFVHDQKDSIALVASQDGRFTVFSWSECAHMVQAHRIEVLLL